jgi:hypothetical protein
MRFVAIHDMVGNVAALVSIPPDAPLAGTKLEAGQRMTEVEVPEVSYDLDVPSLARQVTGMIGTFRVETEPVRGRLVRKDNAETP